MCSSCRRATVARLSPAGRAPEPCPEPDEHKVTKAIADMTKHYTPPPQPVTVSSFINDTRPKVKLRGDNRLLSDVASELGPNLSSVLYAHSGEVVEYRDGLLHSISAQLLRTLAERHVVFYKTHGSSESFANVNVTLDEGDARGILVSPQFLECLNPIAHVNSVRLPVLRSNGKVELLPEG